MLPSPRRWSRRPSQEELDAADLRGATLDGVDLRGRDLSGRDLEGASLVGADLRGVVLDRAKLKGADLAEAELGGASLRGAVLSGASLARCRGGAASFYGATLSAVDLTAAYLPEADLREAVLDGARADAARLEGCLATGASLRRATARGAALDEAVLVGAVLDEADLSFATMERADLGGASLRGVRMARARLDGGSLVGADLGGADLDRTLLSGTRVEGASFEGVRARRLRVRRVALEEAQVHALQEGGLRPTLQSRARQAVAAWIEGGGPQRALEGLRALIPEFDDDEEELTEALPEPEPQQVAVEAQPAKPARKRHITQEDLVPGADLRVRDLRDFELAGLDLSGSDLRGADLRGLDLTDTVLADCRLDGARLERATLVRADLSRASAERAAFDDARLDSAVLVDLMGEGASFLGARFRGAEFRNTSLVFANLAEADLRACVLTGLDLRGARMDRADLTGAVFDGLVAEPRDLAGALGVTPAVFERLGRAEAPRSRGSAVASEGLEARLSRGIGSVARWLREGGLQGLLGRLQGLTEGALAREGDRRPLRIGALIDPFAGVARVALPQRELVPEAGLAGGDLRGLDLSGLDLSGADLSGAMLDGLELTGTLLRGANLSGASLVGARLRNVDLGGATLSGCRADDARFEAVVLERVDGEAFRGVNARFSGCLWAGANLRGACLDGALLEAEDLAEVELGGASLELAQLGRTDLSRTGLEGADLAGLAGLPHGLAGRGLRLPPPLLARLASSLSLVEIGRRLAALLTRQLTGFAAFVREGGLRRPVVWIREGGLQALVRQQLGELRGRLVRHQPEASLLVPGAVLAGMDMRRARLVGLDLRDCIFDAADLRGADLRKARLKGATFRGARMDGARLEDADLEGADLEGANLSRARMSGCRLAGARLLTVDLERGDLIDTDLEDADLSGARLALCDLAGARLGQARVDGADFVGALGVSDAAARDLQERGAQVEERADAVRSIARARAWLEELRSRAPEEAAPEATGFRDQDLRERPLAGRDLRGADLRGARLEDMDLRGTLLAGARLGGARMARARLEGADLSGARAEGVDLSDASLEAADLRGIDAREARLVGASLRGARLEAALLAGVDLSAADLTDTDLADADLSGAELARALVEGALVGRVVGLGAGQIEDLVERGALLDVAAPVPVVSEAPEEERRGLAERVLDVLPGRRRPPPSDLVLEPGVDLSGRDLRRVVLAGLDLSGANLREARLDGADLRETRLQGARLDGARFTGARLSGADLSAAAAAEARFDDADLQGARLGGLRAPGASFVGADLRAAAFADTSLVDCDLSAADLRGTELADSDLSGALLEQTELEGAGLDHVVVHGTDLVGALGLESAQVDALTARGAQVAAFRLPSWLRSAVAPRALGLLATVTVAVIGFVLLVKSGPQTGEALEGAALSEVELGEVDAAVLRYEELLEMSAASSERIRIRYEIARLYEDEGRLEEAVEQYRAANAEAETGEDAAETSLRLARVLAERGDRPAERAAYGEVLTRIDTPSALYARALVGLTDSHRAEGDPERAEAAMAEWMGTMSHNSGRALTVSVEMAELWAAGGEYERALGALGALDGYRLDAEQRARVQLAQAKLHANRGDYSAADALYAELVRNPRVDRGRTALAAAEVAWHLGDPERAQRLLDAGLRGTHPETEARILLLKARLLREAGEVDAAVALYQRILEVHASDPDAYAAAQLGLAESLSDEEQLAMVEGLLDQGEQARAAQILLSRARRLRVTGDPSGAEELYGQVLDLEAPVEARIARFELAQAAIEDERIDEGINQLREIQSEVEGTERVEVEAAIADALRAAGRLDDAEFAYSGLVAAYPAGSEAAVRGLLGKALVAEARGEVEDARRGYLAVLEQTSSPTLRSEALAALAGNYMETGESEAALTVWRDFLAELPEGHEAAFDANEAIAQILRARGERQAALETYEKVLEGTSSAERRARAKVAVGELLEEDGRFGDAEQLYRDLLEDPALPEDEYDTVLVGLIRTLLSLERPDEALTLARDSEVYDAETDVTMRSLQAQALRALGRPEEAARFEDQIAEEAEELDDAFSIALTEANVLVNEWDFEGAIAAYEGLLPQAEDRPTQAMIVGAIAQARGLSGDLEGARAGYRALARDYDDLDEAVFAAEMGLAWVDRQAGHPELAIERYGQLVGPDPGSEVWRLEQLATTLQQVGDDDGSERVYKDLIRAHPGDVFAQSTGRYGLAELMRNRGELAAARGLYEQVARSSPDANQRTWAGLHAAMIQVDEGRLDEAEEALEDLLDESEDDEVRVQAAIGLSSVELERGNPSRALDALDEVDAEKLGGGWVATLTQQRATCLVAMGEPKEAERAWVVVLRDYEDIDDIASQARLALGDLAVGQDAPEDAIGRYERVLSETGDPYYRARALLGRGDALAQMGRASEARASYEQVLEEHPEQEELVAIARAKL